MRKLVTLLLVTGLAACGGGGGGGGEGSGLYSGTWNFQGTKLSDNCRSGVAQNISVDLIVNQDGDSVTIQSGSLVATGSVNDRDGVSATFTRPAADGCVQGLSIVFANASDGNAEVGYAIAAQCGRVTCAVGYGGIAVRTGKTLSDDLQGNEPDSMFESLGEVAIESQEGAEGGIASVLEETQLSLDTGNTNN
ncbi:MAG: hypothetical protein ACK5GN_10640 [Pseudomonadota bacterium]|jgi:hypothetical protein